MLDDRRNVARYEVAALAVAYEQGRILSCGDEMLRLVGAEDAESVSALDAAQDSEHRLKAASALLVVVGDKLRHDLGVRLGAEHIALGAQEVPQLDIVFDYSVMHDGDLAVAAQMRVSVYIVRLAVGRPTGVPDADRTLDAFAAVYNVAQDLEPALGFFDLKLSFPGQHGDAGRVVASVLKPLKPVEQYGSRLLCAYKANYSAHNCNSFRIIFQFNVWVQRVYSYPY